MDFSTYLKEQGIIKPYNGNPLTLKGLTLGVQFFQLPNLERFKYYLENKENYNGSLGYLGTTELGFTETDTYINPFLFADNPEEIGQIMGGN